MNDPIKWRRRKAYVLRVQGVLIREIGERLGVSESTASGDVRWIEAEVERLGRLRPVWPVGDGP